MRPCIVEQQIAADTLDKIRISAQEFCNTIVAFAVHMSEEQKKEYNIKVSDPKEYSRLLLLSQIANNNINSLPPDYNPAELASKLNYDHKLEEVRQVIHFLLEMISDTQIANATDINMLVDEYITAIRVSPNSQ